MNAGYGLRVGPESPADEYWFGLHAFAVQRITAPLRAVSEGEVLVSSSRQLDRPVDHDTSYSSEEAPRKLITSGVNSLSTKGSRRSRSQFHGARARRRPE